MTAKKEPFYQRRAQEDVDTIVEFIAQDNLEAAGRFYNAVENTAAMLVELPNMGSPRSYPETELQNVRIFRVKDFEKYLIFYREIEETIEIVRIVHGARDLPKLFS